MLKNNTQYNLFLCIVVGLLLPYYSFAQQNDVADSTVIVVKPYTSLRGHTAIYDNEMQWQENASRVGFELKLKKNNFTIFSTVELQVNLFESSTTFNSDAQTSGQFLEFNSTQSTNTLTTRLGILGFDFGKYGSFIFGKQWSAFYDITGYTDLFNVFGGQASCTYIGGSDGGFTGTGRADHAMVYRNSFGKFVFAGQIQANDSDNNRLVDGFGISVQYEFFKNFKGGAAFNKTFFDNKLISSKTVLGLNSNPQYLAFGASYHTQFLEINAVYSQQKNGDFVNGYINDPINGESTPTLVFDAHGFELFARYRYKKWFFLGGFNYLKPEIGNDVLVNGINAISNKFKKQNYILGAEYRPFKQGYFYTETRLSNGYNQLGIKDSDVFVIGIRINLDRKFEM